MGEICILHAPETWEFSRHAAAALAGEGHSVFRRETGAAVADDPNADAVVVVWSPAILAAPEMLDAARRALARRILVPISLGGVEPPSSFAHVLPIDLSGWQGDRNDPRWQFVHDEVDLAVRRNEAAAESAPRGERTVWVPPQMSMRMVVPAALAVAAIAGVAVLLVPHQQFIQPDDVIVAAVRDGHARETAREPEADRAIAGLETAGARQGETVAAPADDDADLQGEERLVAQAVERPLAVAAAPDAATETELGTGPAETAPAPLSADAETQLAEAEVPDEALAEGDADPGAVDAAEAAMAAADAVAPLALPPPAIDDFTGVVFRDCAACPDMAEIPATPMEAAALDGFVLVNDGSNAPFALSRREVTFAEWNACVADGACRAVSDAGWGRDRRPVINVSFEDAQGYVAWLTAKTGRQYRLPSEAEWDVAAAVGETSGAANLGAGRGMTAPAGSFAPSVYGLYDMRGNVWEWVADCSPAAAGGADCSRHIVKGGAWNTPAAAGTTGTKAAVEAGPDVGFRVARDLS